MYRTVHAVNPFHSQDTKSDKNLSVLEKYMDAENRLSSVFHLFLHFSLSLSCLVRAIPASESDYINRCNMDMGMRSPLPVPMNFLINFMVRILISTYCISYTVVVYT
jgi:hypothetical protein